MFWTKKIKLKNALKLNNLIHDAIIMSIFDKYYKEESLENNNFELQLLGRALNWAVPDPGYVFENDLDRVEDGELKERLKEDEDQIFIKGLDILNSDPLLISLVTSYITYEIYLLTALFPKNTDQKYPGIIRMKKFLFQTLEKEPDIKSINFREDYKELFISFNNEYGKYGKILKQETIDSLFSFI